MPWRSRRKNLWGAQRPVAPSDCQQKLFAPTFLPREKLFSHWTHSSPPWKGRVQIHLFSNSRLSQPRASCSAREHTCSTSSVHILSKVKIVNLTLSLFTACTSSLFLFVQQLNRSNVLCRDKLLPGPLQTFLHFSAIAGHAKRRGFGVVGIGANEVTSVVCMELFAMNTT